MTSELAPPIFGLPSENLVPSISAGPQSAGHSFSNLSLVQSHAKLAVDESPDHYEGTDAQQTLQAGLIQAKLSVSQPSDPLEKEADRVADQVMRTPDPTVQRQCEDCAPGASCPKCEGEKIQRKACSGHSPDVPPTLSSSMGSLHGGGQPLPASTRAFFEPRLGFDFSQVRVHTDQKAADSARAIQARAFTVGQEITFAAEQFAPQTEGGKRLLAHELIH